jgi:methyl-accepting chemotaxis protein
MKMKLSVKLMSSFVAIGLTPFLLVATYAYQTSNNAVKQAAMDQMVFVREAKKTELTEYMDTVGKQILTYSENRMIVDAMTEFSEAFGKVEKEYGSEYAKGVSKNEKNLQERYIYQEKNTSNAPDDAISQWWPKNTVSRMLQHLYISDNNFAIGSKHNLEAADDGSSYSAVHKKYHPIIRNFITQFEYYDIFLVEPKSGNIVYSVFKEVDYATSLVSGPYRDSSIGKVFAKALRSNRNDKVHFADFEPYSPSYNSPAAFISSPIMKNQELVGVLIFQLPISRIDKIMTNSQHWEDVGMGNSGESFLIGPDFKFRSNSRPLIDNSERFYQTLKKIGTSDSVSNSIKKTDTVIGSLSFDNAHVKEALSGETHIEEEAEDYLNNSVVLAHTPVEVFGINWALIVTKQSDETFSSMRDMATFMWIAGLLCIVAVIIAGWFFARNISNPLKEVVSTVSTSSSQISSMIDDQEKIIAQQGASVNQTNSTMTELDASAKQSAEQAESSAESARKVMELTNDGLTQVEELRQSMTETQEKVEAIAQQIVQFSDQTAQIRNITSMVSGFANETKMLAMNAAVEAVRAGEHGKGFSVLAVETRKLADESKKSAERINSLVEDIQKATNTTVMVTEEGTKTVAKGMRMSEATTNTLHNVSDAMGCTLENSLQISLNAKQQSAAIQQVVEAMQSLNSASKDSSSGVIQVKGGIDVMNSSSLQLSAMV